MKSPRQPSPRDILIAVFILSLLSFLLVRLFHSALYRTMDIAQYLVFHNIAEFFGVMVSLSIFGVGWYTYEQSKNRHALFLSTAFLGIGLMDFMHALGYAGMPDLITANSANKSTQFWIAVRLFSATAFLISAYVYSDTAKRWLTKLNLAAAAFGSSALVFVGVIYYPSLVPATFIEGTGLTTFKVYSEYLIVALLALAFIAYWKRLSITGDRLLIYYMAAFILCIFSELAFTLYKSAFDTYNVLGHIYKIIAFLLIYQGIFIASVKHPYVEVVKMGKELHKSNELIERVFSTTNVLLAYLDRDFNFIKVNEAYAKAGRNDPEYFIGKNHFDLYPHEENEKIFRRVAETGEPFFVYGKPFEHPDQPERGTTYWDWSLLPVKDQSGYVYGLVFSLLDITERKRAEELVKRAEEEWKDTFNAMSDWVSIHDADMNIVKANEALGKNLGVPPEELLGKKCYSVLHNREEPLEGCPLVKSTLSKKSEHIEVFEPFLDRWLSIACSPLFDGKGEVIGTAHVVRDITERKEAEEKIREYSENLEQKVKERTADLEEAQKALVVLLEDVNQAKEEIQEANIQLKDLDRLKSMFIASMSHELRTPLNSIIGFTGIILQGITGEITEEQRKQLTMVKNSANHLLDLINDIIDMSKIEAGKAELTIEEFDLSGVMQEVKDSFRVAAEEKGLKMSLKMPKRLSIMSDERRIKQVLVNLVGNAVKFTEEGEIEIKAAKKDGTGEISVRDTGVGIREEDIDRLFRAFGQISTEGRPTQEGTGLGLYISKKIADLLGGDIWAESEFGKGSVFTFVLPLKYREVRT